MGRAELEKIIRVIQPDLKIFIGESITGNDCIDQATNFNNSIEIDANIYYDSANDTLSINDEAIQLNNKDAKLLKLFLQNKDTLVTHETIYSTLWEYGEDISESALRTYIKNLRKYLGKEKIVSIKKLGYRFTTK